MNFIQKKIKAYTDEKKPDYLLFLIASTLVIISMIFSYSLSVFTVDYFDYSDYHFFIRQVLVGIVSILIMWTLAHIKPEVLFDKYKIAYPIYKLQDIEIDDKFDAQLHIRDTNSKTVSGKISEVLLSGWINTKNDKIIKMSIVKV